MPTDQQSAFDLPASIELEVLDMPASEPTPPANDAPNPNVNIQLEDMTIRIDEVNQVQQVVDELKPEVRERVMAILRQPDRTSSKETTQEYNERVKRNFTEQVMEARRQAAAPPPPPQPVAPAIHAQTMREMARGAKQSAYWAEQQKVRPLPNARDVAAAGTTTPVFQPASYTHEKGMNFDGKQYTVTNTPGR